MVNAWLKALKEWNSTRDMWCMPRKGTAEYDQVRALMPERASTEPKAKKEAPVPKIAEGVSRAELEDMLESYQEDRRKLATAKGAKLRKGMDRIDKLEGAVKEKLKEMSSPAAPKAKRTIKVSKKVFEPAAPASAPSSGEERMKMVSAALKKQDEELAEKEKKRKAMAARKAIEKRVRDRLKNA